MGKDIICKDCSAIRSNPAYKNTRYCKSCRLLRDLDFVGELTRDCKNCRRSYAPTSRRDSYCGPCGFGSIDEGRCVFCSSEHAELYRAGISVCCTCVRAPEKRRSVIAALKKGQRQRRATNQHPAAATKES